MIERVTAAERAEMREEVFRNANKEHKRLCESISDNFKAQRRRQKRLRVLYSLAAALAFMTLIFYIRMNWVA